MITTDEFVEECPNAANESEPVLAVKEVVERALSDGPDGLSEDPGLQVLSCDESLTVVRVVIPCGLGKSLPHDHRMWAVSGWQKARRPTSSFSCHRRQTPRRSRLATSARASDTTSQLLLDKGQRDPEDRRRTGSSRDRRHDAKRLPAPSRSARSWRRPEMSGYQ